MDKYNRNKEAKKAREVVENLKPIKELDIEMDKPKYVATIKDCRQYSESEWDGITRVKEITKATTLKDLIDWQKKIYKHNNKIQNGNIEPMQILTME